MSIDYTNYIKPVSIHATLAGGDARLGRCMLTSVCFYPRHPRGWRQGIGENPRIDVSFLSTPPSRVATRVPHIYPGIVQFLSTPPSRVATEKKVITNIVFNRFYPRHPRGWRRFFTVIFGTNYYVSIHATLAGGDYTDVRHRLPHLGFYPRHPRGWRLRFGFTCRAVQRVSIHATLAGGDCLFICRGNMPGVSIHATLAGGDCGWRRNVPDWIVFLSTPPSRVATTVCPLLSSFLSVSIHATLAGGDRGRRRRGQVHNSFYPRHPRGWRRSVGVFGSTTFRVSIHATLAGGDRGSVARGVMAICFYPRHPRGWRLPHGNSKADPTASFYPRHPRGWRPSSTDPATPPSRVSIHATLAGGDELAKPGRKLTQSVSIHATLAGGDPQSEREPLGSRCFYPRHPRGWRLMR